MKRRVYFVGSEAEVAHHAAPLFNVDSFSTHIMDAENVVAKAEAGDVAIFFSEHFDRFRQAVAELKAKRVATIYLVDGILEWRNAWENSNDEPACPFTMRPVLCDKVAAIGSSQARVLAGWGNGGKIEVVGIPRIDQLAEDWRKSDGHQASQCSAPLRILVATAKTPGFTPNQVETTTRSLADLKAYFDCNPVIEGRTLQVKWRLTAGLDSKIGVENSLSDLSGRELHDAIADCDAFITTPSTSMLEAMLQQKPVALLDYHQCPDYVQAAWTIHCVDAIEPTLNKLAKPESSRLHFQNALVFDSLQIAQPATDRLVQLIQLMFNACDQQLPSNNSLEFAASLLPQPVFASQLSGPNCKMDFASVFTNYNEFTDDFDSHELRAQLAHARREVEYQKRICDGLKAELAEAHSIFEQIHLHPIAGPIVRLRERFINFMKRNRQDS